MSKVTDESDKIQIAVILSKLVYIGQELKEIKEAQSTTNLRLSGEYATKEWVRSEYDPSKKIVNGLIILVITAVLGALLSVVVINIK